MSQLYTMYSRILCILHQCRANYNVYSCILCMLRQIDLYRGNNAPCALYRYIPESALRGAFTSQYGRSRMILQPPLRFFVAFSSLSPNTLRISLLNTLLILQSKDPETLHCSNDTQRTLIVYDRGNERWHLRKVYSFLIPLS
jgi:hypothetical protein